MGAFVIGSTVLTFAAAIAVCEFLLGIRIFKATDLTLTRLFGGLLMALCSGALGFIDDYVKVVKNRNLGLTARQKLFGQLLVGLGYSLSLYMAGGTAVTVPYFGQVEFGPWFIPFTIFVVVSMSNAVNFTDGIDGLCGTVSFMRAVFVVASELPPISGRAACAITAGAIAGFLVEFYPAKVFMGDTGAVFGRDYTAFAFGINQPFVLVLWE